MDRKQHTGLGNPFYRNIWRRLGFRLALFAILLPTLLTYAQGIFSGAVPSQFQFVCTQIGVQFVAGSFSGDGSDPANRAVNHCVFCTLDHQQAIAVTDAVSGFSALVSDRLVTRLYKSTLPNKAYLKSLPIRAPPPFT